jgi:hypothetical protein
MKATPKDIEKFMQQLGEMPQRIHACAAGLDDARLHWSPDTRTWSAAEILAHIRACADVWTFSVYAILAEKEPVLADINERKWAKIIRYAALPFHFSLQAYALQRSHLLQILRDLPFESWERSATILGRRHTVFTQVRRMAIHETEHLEQLKTLLTKV